VRNARQFICRWFVRACIGVLVLLGTGWLAFFILVRAWPYPMNLEQAPADSTLIEDRDGKALLELTAPDGQWRRTITYEQISPHLRDAIIAVEDSHFYQHSGVDWPAVAAAAWQDLRHLHIGRGASTIAMQVQHLRQPRPRTFLNKAAQAVRATQLVRSHSRREILTEYLNRAPFGGNLVGAEAASQFYFHCSCSQLSLAQAALLAGLPQSPNRLRPDWFPDRARKRRDHVLDRMLACGMIDQRQFDEAKRELISVATERRDGIALANGALPTLVSISQNSREGIIAVSLDSGIQQTSFHNAQQGMNELSSNGIDSIAVVVLDTANAQCLAAVSLGPKDSKIDLTRRPRSTGSTLKPLIYAAAFDAGICTPDTILNDAPAAWAGYAPSDYDKEFKGPISAANALAESRNIPALCVLKEIGVEPAIEIMQAAGLRSLGRQPARYGLSLAIGGAEATPMEIAEAYAMLAGGGIARQVNFSATNSAPSISPSSEGRRIFRESACWQTMTALSDFDRTAAVCREAANRLVAWKTGTSSGHRDAWCAAATPSYTVVVWLGNETGSGSSSLVGAEAAAPIALRLISSIDSSVHQSWPAVNSTDSIPLSRIGSNQFQLPRVTLLAPGNGQTYLLDDVVPLDHQRVAMKAVIRGETSGTQIWWFVDGAALGAGESGKTNWWTPTRGSHEIRAVDESGRSASATIDVR